ncbi:MAG: nuclear transport factor 2 family protein [Candidatus Thorarchaeota archaeon]|jgi:ketosteroid isomerase-like protein
MKLEDRLEIQELIAKLAYTHDTMDLEGYRDLYTEDVLRSNKWKDKEPEYREGREKSVGATVNRLRMLREQGIMDRHYYLNPILEPVSDDEVKGVVSFLIVQQQGDDAHPSLTNSGLADLVFRRTDRGWKIAQFHIKFDIPDPRPK